MFGRGKKKKDAEAEDAFGHAEQAKVTVSTTTQTTGVAAGVGGELSKLLGAVQAASEGAGGDPKKLAEELRESLAAQGINATVQSADGPTVITGLGGGTESPEDAKLARIEKLGQLKAQGLLTDEEFQAEKAKVLGS